MNGTIATAASAAPATPASTKPPTGAANHPFPAARRAGRACTTRSTRNAVAATIAWKLDSGWPQRNWSPTTAPSPAIASPSGRRTTRSVAYSSSGISAHTLACG